MLLTATPSPTPAPTVNLTVMPTPAPSPAVTVVVSNPTGHDLFDVLSAIVVPLVVGLGTLAVAGLALRVSRRAAGIEDTRRDEERRQWRYDRLPEVKAWFAKKSRINEAAESVQVQRLRAREAEDEVRRQLGGRPTERGIGLMAVLNAIIDRGGVAHERMNGEHEGMALVDEWANDPASVVDSEDGAAGK